MTSLCFGRNLLGLGLAVVVLTGCGGTAIPSQQPAISSGASLPGLDPTHKRSFRDESTSTQWIYVADSKKVLWRVTTDGKQMERVGSEGVLLTDIAFDPTNGNMYGVSFTHFYRVNPNTGSATLIGSNGLSEANALISARTGKAFTASFNTTRLYSINIKTGATTVIGSNGRWESAGALTFYNGALVLSGRGSSADSLVWLNPTNAKIERTVPLGVADLYGLASTANNVLYGFANTNFYRISPDVKTIGGRTHLIVNLDRLNFNVGKIYGAAYDGNFQE